jgi:hypothetical protein
LVVFRFFRPKLLELALPVAQDVLLHADHFRGLANFKRQLLRNIGNSIEKIRAGHDANFCVRAYFKADFVGRPRIGA